jgi:hypothetical protein
MVILGTIVCVAYAFSAQSEKPPNLVAEVVHVRFVSDPLLNLHHVLYAAAWARRPDRTRSLAGELPASLDARMTGEERAAWDAAVGYYDVRVASRDLLRARGMYELKAALAAGNLGSDAVGAVIARLEKLYGVAWFTSPVRADVVWVANSQGAYTTIGPPPHAVISIETNDWAAVEIVFHEFSHVLVLPLEQRLARALGDRLRDLFNRAWPQYRKPVETNWEPYVHGTIGLDDAIAGTLKTLERVK